ncbi:MAG: SEL1-like repeat protein, partial [Novosphingobium sp.]|nr:SEL1-like repeat protein [Novosphingobium sp.]
MVRTLFPIGIFLGASLLAVSPALAGVKAGVDAWSRGNYPAAVREWRGPADEGDADAQFNLGQAYKLGRGVERDLSKAEELFGKAAEQGHLQASDNYGLLLFQRGEHARAMPFINAAAGRGDPRAQYLLGLAYFNGDNVAKDWVRAYALLSLAQQAGLPQAAPALAQMDQYVPIEQRQRSVALASQLAGEAEATRARQVAAADLASGALRTEPGQTASMNAPGGASPTAIPRMPSIASAERALADASRVAGNDNPGTAGAHFTPPKAPGVTSRPQNPPPPPP